MLAAIEIYNKPQIEYRDECFVILLMNAWELFLKAILSKNKQMSHRPRASQLSLICILHPIGLRYYQILLRNHVVC